MTPSTQEEEIKTGLGTGKSRSSAMHQTGKQRRANNQNNTIPEFNSNDSCNCSS